MNFKTVEFIYWATIESPKCNDHLVGLAIVQQQNQFITINL